jgi:hypothetical protein
LFRHPVVAFGVLKWIETNVIGDKGYFTANFITGQVPLHLAILDRVCGCDMIAGHVAHRM